MRANITTRSRPRFMISLISQFLSISARVVPSLRNSQVVMEKRALEVADQAHRRWLVSSDPEEHVEQVGHYINLGFTHLIFHAPGDDQSRFLQLYAQQILPRLRERWG